MKRIFVSMCVITMAVMTVMAEDHLGVQVGYAQSITRLNEPITGKETVLDPISYNGLKLGVVYDATIVEGFGVTLGLNYTFGANATDWMKQIAAQTGLYPKVRSLGQYHQLEIPVEWQYKFEIARRTWLMLYTGPTLQCGLVLKDKWYIRTDNKSDAFTHEEDFYSEEMEDYMLKRLNVTWGIGAGLQYNRYFLRAGYDFGLFNPYKAQSFTGKDIYTRGRIDQWQIKLGMYLWEF
jgi:hypothetical protein